MHLKIDAQATEALKNIREHIKELNAFADKRWGTVASQVILRFGEPDGAKEFEGLASELCSAEAMRKALLARLESLTKGADEKSIHQLERRVRLLESST